MALRFYGSGAAAVFAPLETLSRSELVARRLTDAIALGLIPDSEQLPGEADLAGIFGVSTTTIREALSSLRLRGLIHTRRGRGGGSFVRAQDEMSTAIVRDRLEELSLAQLRDLGDHYSAIAGYGGQARGRARDTGRRAAARRGLRQPRDAPKGLGGRRRADAQFHIEVAATAQSTRLYRAEVSLQAEVGHPAVAGVRRRREPPPDRAELPRRGRGDRPHRRRRGARRRRGTGGRLDRTPDRPQTGLGGPMSTYEGTAPCARRGSRSRARRRRVAWSGKRSGWRIGSPSSVSEVFADAGTACAAAT